MSKTVICNCSSCNSLIMDVNWMSTSVTFYFCRYREPYSSICVFNIMLPYSQIWALMAASARSTVLSLYARVFRIARTWQAQSGVQSDTETERKYIVQEARALFRHNQQVWNTETRLSDQEHQGFRASGKTNTVLCVLLFSAHRCRINTAMYRRMWSKDRNRYDWRDAVRFFVTSI